MKKRILNALAALTLCFNVSAQTTVTISATGTAGSFNTGSVNSGGIKNDGNMININATTNAGWAKFDLTSIPAGAVVTSANCAFTTYTTISSAVANNLYGFVGDPSSIPGANLYTVCNSGTTFNSSTWVANAINTKTLNAAGVSFIQSNISSSQVCIGFSRGSTNNYNIYGYPGTAAQQPMIVITYTTPPPCAGAPNAGTATASNTLLCSAQNVNLNLNGSTSATGLTYQWQSSSNGTTWSPITTATNIATTQSVTSTTFYQCAVACGTNVATSSVITVTVDPNAAPLAGVISGTNNVNNGTVNTYTISPSQGNIQWYTGTTATGPWSPISTATVASNQPITAVGSGTVYYTVIASLAGCTSDTANTPYQVTVNFPNDVCDVIALPIGTSTALYDLFGATAQVGEVVPPGGGCLTNTSWCNTTLNNTRWFSFVSPASGNITIQSPGFDTQIALWKAATCSDLLSSATATLLAANDDDSSYVAHGGVQFSSFLKAACLTPGATYFIQLDSYTAATASNFTKVLIMDLGSPLNSSFTGLSSNYCSVDPASALTGATTGGIFTVNTSTAAITSFDPAASGVGTFTVSYAIFGCVSNSVTTVNVCTGVKELTKDGISIYPNPTSGITNVSIHADLTGNTSIEIYDIIGKLVIRENLNKDITSINTSKLENGIYSYKIINSNQSLTVGKIIKQ